MLMVDTSLTLACSGGCATDDVIGAWLFAGVCVVFMAVLFGSAWQRRRQARFDRSAEQLVDGEDAS